MNVQILPILIILSSLLFVGCATTKPIPVNITAIDRAPLVLPAVDPVKMHDIFWYIISDRIAEGVFEEVVIRGNDPVLFGLTDEDYKRLGINQAKMLRLIQQQRAVIEALKDYYMENNNNGTGRTR